MFDEISLFWSMTLAMGIAFLGTEVLKHFQRLSKKSGIMLVGIASLIPLIVFQPWVGVGGIFSDIYDVAQGFLISLCVTGLTGAFVVWFSLRKGTQVSGSQLWRDSQRRRMTKYKPKSSDDESDSAEEWIDVLQFLYLPMVYCRQILFSQGCSPTIPIGTHWTSTD